MKFIITGTCFFLQMAMFLVPACYGVSSSVYEVEDPVLINFDDGENVYSSCLTVAPDGIVYYGQKNGGIRSVMAYSPDTEESTELFTCDDSISGIKWYDNKLYFTQLGNSGEGYDNGSLSVYDLAEPELGVVLLGTGLSLDSLNIDSSGNIYVLACYTCIHRDFREGKHGAILYYDPVEEGLVEQVAIPTDIPISNILVGDEYYYMVLSGFVPGHDDSLWRLAKSFAGDFSQREEVLDNLAAIRSMEFDYYGNIVFGGMAYPSGEISNRHAVYYWEKSQTTITPLFNNAMLMDLAVSANGDIYYSTLKYGRDFLTNSINRLNRLTLIADLDDDSDVDGMDIYHHATTYPDKLAKLAAGLGQ